LRIVVTVDTEADGQWRHGAPLTTENVAWWQPFQALCAGHGAPPTYLVTSEIAADERAVAFLAPLAGRGAAEVGAHLHPWTTPPFEAEPGLAWNDPAHAYPCHLDEPLLAAKLRTLTTQIADAFGAPPTAFRAGRFGLDARGARLLAGLGYVVDSSLTPYVSWAANPGRPGWGGGPDFRRRGPYPFRVAGTGAPGLVELPVTILPTYAATRRWRALRERWEARPLRAGRRALRVWRRPQPLWLRPRPEYAGSDLEALLHEAERRHLPFAVFMVHSSELMPGGSPYRRTQASVDELLGLLHGLLGLARRRGHSFTTLSAAGRELAAYDRLPVAAL
jgi:hypothetical protein